MIAKKKVDGGQGAAVVGLVDGGHLVFGIIAKKKKVDWLMVVKEMLLLSLLMAITWCLE